MTDDGEKKKLTLSSKSTLTLKNLGDRTAKSDGKKIVQVEVSKKRGINPAKPVATETKVQIDEATAQKLKLLAEAKEHEALRRQQEEERARQRQEEKEQEEKEAQEKQRQEEEARQRQEEKAA